MEELDSLAEALLDEESDVVLDEESLELLSDEPLEDDELLFEPEPLRVSVL